MLGCVPSIAGTNQRKLGALQGAQILILAHIIILNQ